LVDIVAGNDLGALTLVPGVGKKTAERLLVELRNRLNLPMLDPLSTGSGSTTVGNVREALAGLGYAPEEIREAMRELSDTDTAEDLLRDALRLLGVRRA
jgi:Holliday junction DNA helicase RuvA